MTKNATLSTRVDSLEAGMAELLKLAREAQNAPKAAKSGSKAKGKSKAARSKAYQALVAVNKAAGRMDNARYACTGKLANGSPCKAYWWSTEKSVEHTSSTGHKVETIKA